MTFLKLEKWKSWTILNMIISYFLLKTPLFSIDEDSVLRMSIEPRLVVSLAPVEVELEDLVWLRQRAAAQHAHTRPGRGHVQLLNIISWD